MNDAWFFVGVFAFIFLIWIATGGPARPLSFAGPTLAQPEELGGGTYLSLPRAPYSIGSSRSNLSGGDRDYSNGSSRSSFRENDLFNIIFGNPSPYHSLVTLSSSVAGASSTNVRREYVRLSVSRNATSPINITEWRLVSEATGNAAPIPAGTTMPTGGRVNAYEPIILQPGERAYINTSGSPVGISFRENKCTGYFSQYQDFTPSLPRRCPSALDELERHYGQYYFRDESCVAYVKRIGRCEAVLYPDRDLSTACKAFLKQHLNYNGCVAAHKDDPDFRGDTWRIYLGYNDALWRSRNEVLKLFDLQNKTVDAIRY